MMRRLGSASMLAWFALAPALAAPPQGRITYCCTDNNGKKVCSDVLPEQCYGRAYREINSRGMTVRQIDAPMSAEQRAAKDAETKRAKEAEILRLEQDRKNRALLATYPTEKDIDEARDRTLGDIDRSIKAIQAKQAELSKRKQQLDQEAEFYKKRTLPPQLQAQMNDNAAEMKTQQDALENREKEIEAVKIRFADEKARYRELTQKKTTAAKPSTQGQASTGPSAAPR